MDANICTIQLMLPPNAMFIKITTCTTNLLDYTQHQSIWAADCFTLQKQLHLYLNLVKMDPAFSRKYFLLIFPHDLWIKLLKSTHCWKIWILCKFALEIICEDILSPKYFIFPA